MRKIHAVILCLICTGRAVAAQDTLLPQTSVNSPSQQSALSEAAGLLVLDYEKITLTNGGKFDLFGAHYLHQLNDWLYFGAGLSGPLVEGNYGGFFSADVTLHAQKRVFGNWFVDAGVAVGAGAGGSSVKNILALSGDGAYIKKYFGLGYGLENFNIGVNYATVGISNSPINDSTLNFYIQKPVSYSVGSYADSGNTLSPWDSSYRDNESIVSFEYDHVSQINPTGKYTGDIGLVSPQYSQFFNDDDYWFVGLDLGYSGLIWYNQAQGGIGRRISLTPNINLYGQLGVGTGGWVTDTINTGPGLVVYPKVRAEYQWNNILGAYFSAGYFFAPKGTSKNWTLGAGINYHFTDGAQGGIADAGHDSVLRGVRLNLFDRQLFNVYSNGKKIDNLNLAAVQLDYNFNGNWYVPFQIAAATNDFKGYAGYVEGLVGLGWQSDLFFADKFQGFAQVMYGLNDIGINPTYEVGGLLNPAIGINYSLSEKYAIYGQVGKTVSLDQFLKPNFTNSFENFSVGLGLTYRFTSPNREAR